MTLAEQLMGQAVPPRRSAQGVGLKSRVKSADETYPAIGARIP